MGIVKLKKVTLYGLTEEKKAVLSDLQGLGCLHIIPLQKKAETGEGLKSDSSANEALKYLLNCPQKRRQIMMPHHFDALSVEKEVLEIRDRTLELEDERDFLQHRIEQLKPFGYFDYSPLEELNHLRLWFYVLPHYRLKSIPEDLAWEVVKRDTRSSYVVVISGEEPQNMPGPRVHVGSRPLAELEAHLEEVLMEIEDLQARRVSLTRWNQLFLSRLHELENAEVLYKVAGQTYDESLLFAMQAWIPVEQLPELKEYAKENGLAPADRTPFSGRNAPYSTEKPIPDRQWAGSAELLHDSQLLAFRSFASDLLFFHRFLCHDYERCGLWRTAFHHCTGFLETNGQNTHGPQAAYSFRCPLRRNYSLGNTGRQLFRLFPALRLRPGLRTTF
jgi:V/A-type H+-transporting ATPase subunit I